MTDKESFELVLSLAQNMCDELPLDSPEWKRENEAILRVMEIADRLDQEDID